MNEAEKLVAEASRKRHASTADRRRTLEARRRRIRRRRATALLVILATAAGGAYAVRTLSGSESPSGVTLIAGGEVVAELSPERASTLATGGDWLPFEARRTVETGGVTREIAVDRRTLRERLASPESGTITVPERTVAARIDTPIVRQVFRNNCETAALSMLLATAGVDEPQRGLQEEIAKATPTDPRVGGRGQMVWGDPNQGFVGRVDGGGPAGGFGVFQGPVIDLAARWGDPVDLSGRDPSAVYERLLAGNAVMVWVGLSDGPYERWRSPDGAVVDANFGEHTVVLTGLRRNRLNVNDPLDGLRKTWSKAEFEAKWDLLDRRAVSL